MSEGQIGIATDDIKCQFIEKLIPLLGVGETTAWKIDFLLEWMNSENTTAIWNPYATTMRVPVEDRNENYNFNHNGGNPVKQYANEEAGLRATANTMKLHYYVPIMNCIRNEKVTNLPAVSAAFKTYSSVSHYIIARKLREGWRPTGRGIPTPSKVSKKPIVQKSARDAGLIVGGAGITAAVAAIAGADFDPIISAIKQQESFSAILVLIMPLAYRVIRAYLGRGPDAN